jgi:hypothetical protein
MYHELFIYTVHNFYGLELCTIYDSHDIYLRVLWTICMYKFSRWSCRCFSRFFRSIYWFSTKIGRFLAKTARKWPHRFSEKPADLSVFPVFTVPSSSPVHFGRIFLIFTNFYWIFQKPTESVMSSFRSSTEFSNTTVN